LPGVVRRNSAADRRGGCKGGHSQYRRVSCGNAPLRRQPLSISR
jgi:hypothetical protein